MIVATGVHVHIGHAGHCQESEEQKFRENLEH